MQPARKGPIRPERRLEWACRAIRRHSSGRTRCLNVSGRAGMCVGARRLLCGFSADFMVKNSNAQSIKASCDPRPVHDLIASSLTVVARNVPSGTRARSTLQNLVKQFCNARNGNDAALHVSLQKRGSVHLCVRIVPISLLQRFAKSQTLEQSFHRNRSPEGRKVHTKE